MKASNQDHWPNLENRLIEKNPPARFSDYLIGWSKIFVFNWLDDAFASLDHDKIFDMSLDGR